MLLFLGSRGSLAGGLFIFVFDIDNTLIYKGSSTLEATRVNTEGVQFLEWLTSTAIEWRTRPEIIAWTDNIGSGDFRGPLDKLAAHGAERFFGQNSVVRIPGVLDRHQSRRYALFTNGIKDLGKLRRRLIAFESFEMTENVVLFMITPASQRFYAYNICYMQYYLLGVVPVIVQTFNASSHAASNETRYHTYYANLGQTSWQQPWQIHRLQQLRVSETALKAAGLRFHDVRWILETSGYKSKPPGALLQDELRLFEAFRPPSQLECFYTPTMPGTVKSSLPPPNNVNLLNVD